MFGNVAKRGNVAKSAFRDIGKCVCLFGNISEKDGFA